MLLARLVCIELHSHFTDPVFEGVFLLLAVLLCDGHDLLTPLELLEEEADSLSRCVQLRALEVVVLFHLVVLSLNVLSLHHPLLGWEGVGVCVGGGGGGGGGWWLSRTKGGEIGERCTKNTSKTIQRLGDFCRVCVCVCVKDGGRWGVAYSDNTTEKPILSMSDD